MNLSVKMADVAMHVHHHQQLPSEIVKHLRQNFKQPTRRYRREPKVRIRTDRYYKPEKGVHAWRQKYNRRVRQLRCGFYTPAHIPYESVGDVGLDLKDLVFNTLDREDKKVALKKQWQSALVPKKEVKIDSSRKVKSAGKQKEKESKGTKATAQNKGGLQEIQDKLCVDNKRMVVLKAGLPYSECRRKEAEEKARELLLEQQNQPEPCISPTRLRQILSKMRTSERTDSACEEGDTGAIDTMSREDSHEDILNNRGVRERNSRNFSSKLNCLHALLCYIYQLRSRDLRSKNPLPKEFLKTLKQSLPLDQWGHIIRNQRNTGNPTNSRVGYRHQSSTDALESRMEGDPCAYGSPHTRPSDFHESISYLFRGGVGENYSSDSRTTFAAKKLMAKLDEKGAQSRFKEGTPKGPEMTWDDLVEGRQIQPPSLGGVGMVGLLGDNSSRGAPVRSSFAQSVRHLCRRRRTGILHHLPQIATTPSQPSEHLSIWQQVAANEKNAKEFKSTGVTRLIQLRRRSRRASKARTLMDNVGEDFNKIKQKTADTIKDKLKQIECQEEKVFNYKFRALKPHHLYPVDIAVVRQSGVKVNKDYTEENLKPADWYAELQKESDINGLKSEIEINQLLDRFYPFAIDDVPNFPFVKAKLCLLIQSLPIYQLCSVAMQEAIQVV